MRDLTERIESARRVFEGRAVVVDELQIVLPDGRRTSREVLRHRGAAVMLAERSDGLFVFIRQYRMAVQEALLEVPAGCLEVGEEPAVGAARELLEETGYRAESLELLASVLPCPGTSEERHHLFYARVGVEPVELSPDSDENLEPVLMSSQEIEAAIASGELHDGKSLLAWLLYKRKNNK